MLTELSEEQLRHWLIIGLVIWIVIMILTARSQWSQKIPSAGLPLLYLFSLMMNHWFGGLIYAFPWYKTKNIYLISQGASLTTTVIGFQQTVYGVIGFALGSLIVAPWLIKLLKPSWVREFPRQPDLKIPDTYIFLGLLFIFVLSPILSKIPSVGALASSGISLFVVGLCLACWKSWYLGNNRAFLGWLLVSFCLPLFTLLVMGFMSFGTGATVVVLFFLCNFYRPRWQLIVTAILVIYFGLSVFIVYFRDRGEIREKVWGGESGSSRIEQLGKTASNFEFFNPFITKHLEMIDGRMNQNVIVGNGVKYISSGRTDYAHGATLIEAAMAPVPRILWPDKPVSAGSGNLVNRYTGAADAGGTSIGVGNVLEFYINFGTWGVFLGFIALGIVLGVIDIAAGQKLLFGNLVGFTSWFLPGMAFIQPIGSFVDIMLTVSASVVLVYLINTLYLSKLSRKRTLSISPYSYYNSSPSHWDEE